ncbi:XRE family transcriptional regulator [uncultured Thiodictyon sp.]|jgi:hypothetical protein|uniref:helix-turn-helix domain-containing protein n=1 Tax=uncultured Thiodictyon sp. TaxID=1846217 RepID=UPI0025DC151F|nr:XRE family transcriptional regulator [uncultured Thiodictyon sp.]
MTQIRDIVAKRLRREADRRGMSAVDVAGLAGQPLAVVDGYFSGHRTISFQETGAICEALTINPVRLFLRRYPLARTLFRGASREAIRAAGRIEDAFLTVREALPPVSVLRVQKPDDGHADLNMLLGTLAVSVRETRGLATRIETLLDVCSVPVISVRAGELFDAFLLTSEKWSAICVNIDRPSTRVHFSLLHEIAHLLYHRDLELPLDIFPPNFYREWIAAEDRQEFVAYKFAQFFALPFEEVESIARRWPAFDTDRACALLASGRVSVDVLTNALFDLLRLFGRTVPFLDLKAQIAERCATCSRPDMTNLMAFLEGRRQDLRRCVLDAADSFSDDVLRHVMETLHLD